MRSGVWRKACLVSLEEKYSYPVLRFFSISLIKCFRHRLPKKSQVSTNCQSYNLNFHQVQYTNVIRCIILQRFNGKCRKLSCKNFRAFSKICYIHSMVSAVGTGKYLKFHEALIISYFFMVNFMEFTSIQGLLLMQYLNQSDESLCSSAPYSDIYVFYFKFHEIRFRSYLGYLVIAKYMDFK